VVAHAPRHLGRFELDGYHASLETAARGQKLAAFLRQPISRRRKLEVLDRVADWLIQVARETAVPVEALAEERERFERQVFPFWADCGGRPRPGTLAAADSADLPALGRRRGETSSCPATGSS